MLIVITGNGKGKTTAAIGQAVRALGHGKKVLFAQFIKSDGYPSGEDTMLAAYAPRLVFWKGGRGFVGILGDTLPIAEHRAAATATLTKASELSKTNEYDLIVLDEINVAISLQLITVIELKRFIQEVGDNCDIIVTGRDAHPDIIKLADYVTECMEIKHPYQQKIKAQKSIEY